MPVNTLRSSADPVRMVGTGDTAIAGDLGIGRWGVRPNLFGIIEVSNHAVAAQGIEKLRDILPTSRRRRCASRSRSTTASFVVLVGGDSWFRTAVTEEEDLAALLEDAFRQKHLAITSLLQRIVAEEEMTPDEMTEATEATRLESCGPSRGTRF